MPVPSVTRQKRLGFLGGLVLIPVLGVAFLMLNFGAGLADWSYDLPFLWRTTARALVGLLPSLLGLLPKTLVAYSGTYVVGQMARYYYRYGHKPPPEMVRDLRDEGTRLARETLSRLKRG